MTKPIEMTNMPIYHLSDASILLFEGEIAHWYDHEEEPMIEVRYSIYNMSEDPKGSGYGKSSVGWRLTFTKEGTIQYHDASYSTPLHTLSYDLQELTEFISLKVRDPHVIKGIEHRIERDQEDVSHWEKVLHMMKQENISIHPSKLFAEKVKRLRLPSLFN